MGARSLGLSTDSGQEGKINFQGELDDPKGAKGERVVRAGDGMRWRDGEKGEGERKEGCSVARLGLARVPSGGGMWRGARVHST